MKETASSTVDDKYKNWVFFANGKNYYSDGKIGHDDYIHTDLWTKVKEKRLRFDNYRCCLCQTGINIEVHHIRYPAVWGEEKIDDMRTFCRSCHEKVHAVDNIK